MMNNNTQFETNDSGTIEALCELYITKHAELKNKPSSVKLNRHLIQKHIIPYFAGRKITEITSRDICEFQYHHRNTRTQANRLLELLSKMFNLAEIWGLRESGNPCRNIDRFKERIVTRFLSPEEIICLQKELDRQKRTTPHAAAAIRLLLLTGCRKSEILAMKWQDIDLRQGVLTLHDSKTGMRMVPLNHSALDVIKKIPRVGDCPYVIANPRTGKGMNDLNRTWRRVRKYTKLEDVRLHDLRHTFASRGVEAGLSLIVISKLLGHKQLQTTQRYAHLAFADALAASNRIAGFMPH
ncbi:MAG: site-specific integrase [Pseudomonadota bacterium]